MELGLQHPPTRKLGMDMLRERGLHHDYVTAMLQDGYYLEALRYARKYKVLGFALIRSSPFHLAYADDWCEDSPRWSPCSLPYFWRKPWRRTAPTTWLQCWASSASSLRASRPHRTSSDTGISCLKWFEQLSVVQTCCPEMTWHVLCNKQRHLGGYFYLILLVPLAENNILLLWIKNVAITDEKQVWLEAKMIASRSPTMQLAISSLMLLLAMDGQIAK